MSTINKRETSRLAIEEAEKKLVISLLRSLTNGEKGKRNTHFCDMVILTAKSRYLKNGDGLGLELGPTIAIAQRFQVKTWGLLLKYWESVPDDVKASVHTIALDPVCWNNYLTSLGKKNLILSIHVALGMIIFCCPSLW